MIFTFSDGGSTKGSGGGQLEEATACSAAELISWDQRECMSLALVIDDSSSPASDGASVSGPSTCPVLVGETPQGSRGGRGAGHVCSNLLIIFIYP